MPTLTGYTEIPQYAFANIQHDAGVLLTGYDITSPTTITEDMIVTATNGGFNIQISDEFTDYGEEVDNCPPDMMELKRLTKRTVSISTNAYEYKTPVLGLALAAADISGDPIYIKTTDDTTVTGKTYYTRSGTGGTYTYTTVTTPAAADIGTYYEKIDNHSIVTPRDKLKLSDFKGLTWLGKVGDEYVTAVVLDNCLNTGGFSLQTQKDGKGMFPLNITAHRTMKNPTKIPIKFYRFDYSEA